MDISSNNKNITLPLLSFLEILWGYHDEVNVEESLATLIASIDKDELYCHVEMPNGERELKIPKVWRIKDWNTSYIKWQSDKKRSEEHRVLWNRRREIIADFAQALEMLMPDLSKEDRLERAKHYVETKNVKIAKALGITIPQELIDL